MPAASFLNAVVGEYRLVELLGAGGMGEVYRAVHAKIGRTAAVKVLAAAAPGSDFVQRFLNEARVHANLYHPNIATLYDFLEFCGRPCIVMEYVDGETLVDRIRHRGPFTTSETWRIFRDLVAAVAYVHEQGIVHRDLKSANIRINSKGVVKLLDFGIAKGGATPELTMAGNVIGTVAYMAPEQLRGEPASACSDVWALGIVLYEMLTGRVPFQGSTLIELMDRIRAGTYSRPSAVCPGGERDAANGLRQADRLVARCLQVDPSDRYRSAGAILDDIPRTEPGDQPLAASSAPAFGAVLAAGGRGWLQRVRSGMAAVVARVRAPGAAGGSRDAVSWLGRHWGIAVAAAVVAGGLALFTLLRPAPAVPDVPGVADRSSAAAPAEELPAYRIDVAEGTADVYVNGELKGQTPYDYRARPHETVTLELRQRGFEDLKRSFDVTERRVWTLTMTRVTGRE